MEYFKNYGRLEGFKSLLTVLEPTLDMMSKMNLTQYGLRGRLKDGEIFYGEGRAEPGVGFSEWATWRPGFEDFGIISILKEHAKYQFGRIRIMRCVPYTCYSWHRDTTPRLHVPLITSRGAMVVVGPEIRHLAAGCLWWVDTRVGHTAFNGGKDDRYHIVYEIDA
jgi:hypothetical protein